MTTRCRRGNQGNGVVELLLLLFYQPPYTALYFGWFRQRPTLRMLSRGPYGVVFVNLVTHNNNNNLFDHMNISHHIITLPH